MKNMELAARIRGMEPGHTFQIGGKQERLKVLEAVRVLRQAGVISFVVQTKARKAGGFHAVCLVP